MTIERKDTYLFGLRSQTRIVEPNTEEIIIDLRWPRILHTITVTSPNSVIYRIKYPAPPQFREYHREEINKANLVSAPASLIEWLSGTKKAYSWKP